MSHLTTRAMREAERRRKDRREWTLSCGSSLPVIFTRGIGISNGVVSREINAMQARVFYYSIIYFRLMVRWSLGVFISNIW